MASSKKIQNPANSRTVEPVPTPGLISANEVARLHSGEVARQTHLFGHPISPVTPSITERSTAQGTMRTFSLGDELKAGEGDYSQGNMMRRQVNQIATPAGVTGSTERGDRGLLSGQSEVLIGLVARADARRAAIESMMRDTGAPGKSAVGSNTRLVDRGMRPAFTPSPSVAREAVTYRLPRTMVLPSGNTIPSALNLVGGQGPVEVDKRRVAEGKEEQRQQALEERRLAQSRKRKPADPSTRSLKTETKADPALKKRQMKRAKTLAANTPVGQRPGDTPQAALGEDR